MIVLRLIRVVGKLKILYHFCFYVKPKGQRIFDNKWSFKYDIPTFIEFRRFNKNHAELLFVIYKKLLFLDFFSIVKITEFER